MRSLTTLSVCYYPSYCFVNAHLEAFQLLPCFTIYEYERLRFSSCIYGAGLSRLICDVGVIRDTS